MTQRDVPVRPDIPIRLLLPNLVRLQSFVSSVVPFLNIVASLKRLEDVLYVVVEELKPRDQVLSDS